MTDIFTHQKRSEVMAKIRNRGNKSTEFRLMALMRIASLKGWRRGSLLPGRPDFVFSHKKLAVFVDGDFWHGHPTRARIPTSNRSFWEQKIKGNIIRDRKVGKLLRQRGWKVIRIWESSLKLFPNRCIGRLRRELDKR
jgi:DNA mismatch endonuclease, patch repair protein